MNDLLENPVYNALMTGDRHLSAGNGRVKYFDEEVSPFAGFEEGYEKGFSELHDLLPPGRKILYAIPFAIVPPAGWELVIEIGGLQFIYEGPIPPRQEYPGIVSLTSLHSEEMVQLAKLTKPGPFATRTIEFGSYFGIFEKDKLVAMTGQRLHVENSTEISAVCTHPDHLGKGYAHSLLLHQLDIILRQGQRPFLHVREDNERAIAIYLQLGFNISRPMHFYFLKREESIK
ncbi:MAG: GNAT family N-acetyltransferase [Chitinophagaceae bacterium]